MSFTDEAKDKAQELAGQAEEKTGEATGDQQLQAEARPIGVEARWELLETLAAFKAPGAATALPTPHG